MSPEERDWYVERAQAAIIFVTEARAGLPLDPWSEDIARDDIARYQLDNDVALLGEAEFLRLHHIAYDNFLPPSE